MSKPRVREVFATMAWFIWSHRNKSRLQEKSAPLSGIREAVCNFLQLFSSCREHSGSTKVVRRRTWQPLNPGEYKTNFDGAMFNECNEVGVGIVVRDSKGLVVIAMAKKKKRKKKNLIQWNVWSCWQQGVLCSSQRKSGYNIPTLKVTRKRLSMGCKGLACTSHLWGIWLETLYFLLALCGIFLLLTLLGKVML